MHKIKTVLLLLLLDNKILTLNSDSPLALSITFPTTKPLGCCAFILKLIIQNKIRINNLIVVFMIISNND